MTLTGRSVYFWFGIVFILFFSFRIIEGVIVCETTQWAACPGQLMDDASDEEDNE